jgi:hypothetical protein
MDDFEKDYSEDFLKKVNSIKENSSENINEAKNFLRKNIEFIKEFQIDDEKIKASNKMAEKLVLKLEVVKNINIAAIFNDKMIKFKSNLEEIDDSFVGYFEYDFLGKYHKVYLIFHKI